MYVIVLADINMFGFNMQFIHRLLNIILAFLTWNKIISSTNIECTRKISIKGMLLNRFRV